MKAYRIKEILCCFVLLILYGTNGLAQQYTLSVQARDSFGFPLSSATLVINQKKFAVDSMGQYSISLATGKYSIAITAVGFYPSTHRIYLTADTNIIATPRLRESLLDNITVTSSRNVQRNQLSSHSLGIAQIRRLPVVLGEVDPLKTITLLPGIKSGGEASAGIYVRGGGPDQNLFLLDGMQVYNPNHLLGFFSIFNGEAVKNIDVIKGGMPAEYGGRLSSVINIESREGNRDSIKGSGGIGLISSRISVEGPIIKGRSSFIVSARRTYIDEVGRIVAKSRIGDNGYYFYDINARGDYQVNDKNALFLNFYTGKDKFSFVSKTSDGRSRIFTALWGNTIGGLTWKQKINDRLRHDLALIYNDFSIDSHFGFSTVSFLFTSGLTDYQLKDDWTYNYKSWLKFKWGLQYTDHTFRPGAGGITAGVQAFKSEIKNQYAREAASYVSTDVNLLPRLNVIAGLRYGYFNQVGPTERVLYSPDGVPTGETEKYAKGESIAAYHYPEPRLSLLYRLRENSSLKLSYTQTIQYLHLATTSAATFPSDLWIPSSKLIKPGIAKQIAAGYFTDLKDNRYEVSAEVYYKTMSNQLEFKPGAQLLLNQNLEAEMIFGAGKAYGIELFIQKKKGALTGWVGYTLSRAERQFPLMNNGKAFPYRYDRTHDMSVVANYTLSPKWEASAVFVYGTGNALTMPTGRYTYELGYNAGEQKPIFTNINQYDRINDYRMPAYHRMDIAFTYTPKPLSAKRYRSSWNFSIYNLYNRYNPYFIYLEADEGERTIKGKKVFLFPILPGVTWNFKF